MSERTGTTVTNQIVLKPGLNTFMAVLPRSYAPADADQRKLMVAQAIGQGLGVTVNFVGKEPTGMTDGLVFMGGQARPFYINETGLTQKWIDWYNRLGAPLGPDVHYLPVNLEWRGQATVFNVPVGSVGFPNGTSPRVIGSNWPDGTLEQQEQYLKDSARASRTSDYYTQLSNGMRQVDNFVGEAMSGNIGTLLLWGITIGVSGYIFYKTLNLKESQTQLERARLAAK